MPLIHIVGLDEVEKRRLLRIIPSTVIAVDLDQIQNEVHNLSDIVALRQLRSSADKASLRCLWADKCQEMITNRVDQDLPAIVFGSDLYPPDHRYRCLVKEYQPDECLLVAQSPESFASNQISHYLTTYADAIIRGRFKTSLLDRSYVASSYKAAMAKYSSYGYRTISQSDLHALINKYQVPLSDRKVLTVNRSPPAPKGIRQLELSLTTVRASSTGAQSGKPLVRPEKPSSLYIATLYYDPQMMVNPRMPIYGYLTRAEALDAIKTVMTRSLPVHVYQLDVGCFRQSPLGWVLAQSGLPQSEESLILTDV